MMMLTLMHPLEPSLETWAAILSFTFHLYDRQ